MHVVHYIRHLREEKGGVVRSVLDLTRALASQRWRVTIITPDAGTSPPPVNEACGPHVEVVELPRFVVGRMSAAVRSRLHSIVGEAEVVHLHTMWDPQSLRVASVAGKHDVPYVVSTHGMLDDPALATKRLKKQVYLALAGNRLLKRAALLHATATGERRQVESRVSGLRIEVVPLLFDTDQYRMLPGPELARSKFDCLARPGSKLLFLSRLHFIKGPEIAIQAAVRLVGRHELQLIMAGPGDVDYVAELKQLARKHGLADRVHFVGMVRNNLKLSLYQACDLFVLPTMQENFGMVFPEALACGLPVVTSNTVDTAVELREAGARLLPRTADAFADAIARLLDDSNERQRLGCLGRDKVFEWLNTSRVVERYQAMYASVRGAHTSSDGPS